MASINQVTLLGNCTRDPELRFSASGMAICQIGMAVNHRYGTKEEPKEEVCFVDVVCFGASAEYNAEHLSKGSRVLVTGRLKWETWEGQDGMKRSKHSIVAHTVHPMTATTEPEATPAQEPAPARSQAPRARPSAQAPKPAPKQEPVADTGPLEDDDIPF